MSKLIKNEKLKEIIITIIVLWIIAFLWMIFCNSGSKNIKKNIDKKWQIELKNEEKIIKQIKKIEAVNINFETNNLEKWSEFFHWNWDKTSWKIVEKNWNKILFQDSNNIFNTIIFNEFSAKNAEISVDIKRKSWNQDQWGWIIWRWIDENNYYVVRLNPLEDNVVLYKMENWKRSDLKVSWKIFSYWVKVPVLWWKWNNLKVFVDWNIFEVYLNENKIFEIEDETFTNSWKIWFWTKTDARTYFDNLKINTFL